MGRQGCLSAGLLGVLVLMLVGCGDDEQCPDIIRPSAVRDLAAEAFADSLILLTWTAPGDDGDEGRASTYAIRCAETEADLVSWADSQTTLLDLVPAPGAAGAAESLLVSTLSTDSTCCLAIRAADEASNWSELSSIAWFTPENRAPLACFVFAPEQGSGLTEFQFDASCSHDDRTPMEELLFQWDWENDGTSDFCSLGDPHGAHQFGYGGTYEVVLRVSDRDWAAGCETTSVSVNAILPRTSPESLLSNLREAYALRNVAEYESLLAFRPPAFTFVLSEEDQGQPGMPDQWGRQTEVEIHEHMFDAEAVQTLRLGYVIGTREWDPVENLWSILVSNVNLHLYGIIPGQEEEGLQELEVEGATSRFWFREESWTAPGTSDSVWAIVKWEDNPAGSVSKLGIDPLNWGEVKNLYR
jgi:hypothetical protein